MWSRLTFSLHTQTIAQNVLAANWTVADVLHSHIVYILCPMPTAQCTQPIAQLYPQPQPSTSAHNLVQRHTLHYHWRYVLYARVSYKLYLCATSIVIYSFSYVYSGLIQTLGQQHSPFFFSRIQAVLSNFLNFFLNKPNHEKFTIVKV